jgi:hypothetical protein
MVEPTLASQTAPVNRIRRIYVEPFATREGSEALREDMLAELRKIKSVSLAGDESSADAILGGGGEVWIRGYRSHNPQLGKVPPNGTPIYTGFLSIELRDRNGQTLWSYLATPPASSGDVSKDLSSLIAKKLGEALEQGEGCRVPVSKVLNAVLLKHLCGKILHVHRDDYQRLATDGGGEYVTIVFSSGSLSSGISFS